MIEYYEIEELACCMLGKDYDSIINDYEEDIIERMFYDKYNITIEEFRCIINDLIKFTPTWKSPITGDLYNGFVVKENNSGLMRAIIKCKAYD